MKQFIILLSTVLFTLTSCEKYEDYLYDYEYSATYFAMQKPVRTLVQSDDMRLKVGVARAGVRENTREEVVNFEIDESLLAETTFTLLPENYYTLSDNSKMVIPAGEFLGLVDVDINEEAFMADPLAHNKTYALPLQITETTADSTLRNTEDPMAGKDYTILVIKYISNMHGYYYHKGNEYIYDTEGNAIDTIKYSDEELVRNEVWDVLTAGKDSVVTNGIGGNTGGSYKMALVRTGTDLSVQGLAGTAVETIQDNGSSFNLNEQLFTLDYEYTDGDGNRHHIQEELIFRNDGILLEEW